MAVAIIDFHWTAADFMNATPHEVFAAWELVEARNKRISEARGSGS